MSLGNCGSRLASEIKKPIEQTIRKCRLDLLVSIAIVHNQNFFISEPQSALNAFQLIELDPTRLPKIVSYLYSIDYRL